MTRATKEKEGSGTHCSRGWPCLRAKVILLEHRQPYLLAVGQVVIRNGIQVTPAAIPRYRASPFHQGGLEATALLSGKGEREQVCERERMLLLDYCLCS